MSAQDKASEWVDNNPDEIRKYKFEWIAVSENGVVAHSRRIDKVIDKLDELGLTVEDVVLMSVDDRW